MKVYIKKFLKHYYVMLIPAFLWLIFFSIVPMFGIIMAFEDYNPGLGMLKSPFVGLDNFRYMLQISDVRQAIANTVIIAVAKIICNIIVPLTFAILLNELCLKKMKRPIQTIVYMPHFLSWVILAKIVLNIFGYTGPINQILGFFGQSPVQFFGEPLPVTANGKSSSSRTSKPPPYMPFPVMPYAWRKYFRKKVSTRHRLL